MRKALALLVAVAAAGCQSGPGDDTRSWTLFVDEATIAPVDHAGNEWCAGNGPLEVSVVATVGAATGRTRSLAGSAPVFEDAVVDATTDDYVARALFLDVRGQCATGADFRLGAARLQPEPATVESGVVELQGLGNVERLEIQFVAGNAEPVGASTASAGATGVACTGGQCVDCSDGSDGSDSPVVAGGPIDSGMDPGTGGGDTSGDDGSDSSTCDDCARKPAHRTRRAATARRL